MKVRRIARETLDDLASTTWLAALTALASASEPVPFDALSQKH